jgi:regulatory protein
MFARVASSKALAQDDVILPTQSAQSMGAETASAVSGAAGSTLPAALHARLRQLAMNILASRESNTAKLRTRLLKAGKTFLSKPKSAESATTRPRRAANATDNRRQVHRARAPMGTFDPEQLPALQGMVERVLSELSAASYLSDARYSEMRTRALVQRGKGKHGIAQQLALDGIDKAQRQLVLHALDADIDWRAQALALLRRKFARLDFSQPNNRAKAQRFLLSRGFDSASVRFALQHVGAADDLALDF